PRTGHQPTAPPQPPSTLPCGPPHGTNPPHPSRDRDRDPLGSGTRLRPAGTTHHQTAPHAGRDGRRCAASTGPDPVHPPGWCPTPTPRVDLTPVQLLQDLELHRGEPGPLLLSRNQQPLEIVSRCPLPSHNTNIRPPCDRFRRRRKL